VDDGDGLLGEGATEATQVCDLLKKENFKCKATAFAGDVL
jgi:hypothetical protein